MEREPSIHALSKLFIQFRVAEGLEPLPGTTGREEFLYLTKQIIY